MSYKIRLEVFEGPLDLLLYLIKKEELNIYNIPITTITKQYLEYLNLMEMLDLDIAGEFLVMAATLMQIKSKMLLPPDPDTVDLQEEDPRAELVRRLLEYKAFKDAAEKLQDFEEKRGLHFARFGIQREITEGDLPAGRHGSPFLSVSLFDLITAFGNVLANLPAETYHQVVSDEFTVAEKIQNISERLLRYGKVYFSQLFKEAKNKFEAITIFLALLELIRLKEVCIAQVSHFEEIEISKNTEARLGIE